MEQSPPARLVDLAQITGGEVDHLPIVKAYADRIDLVGTINRLVPSQAEVDPGTLTLAIILDALSGRHPLYRIPDFFAGKDLALLLGQPVELDALTDDHFGRLLDRLYEANPSRLLSALADKTVITSAASGAAARSPASNRRPRHLPAIWSACPRQPSSWASRLPPFTAGAPTDASRANNSPPARLGASA